MRALPAPLAAPVVVQALVALGLPAAVLVALDSASAAVVVAAVTALAAF